MITLSDGTITITLNHLLWSNRSSNRSLGSERVTFGRLVVQRLVVQSGTEIVLEARREGGALRGWFTWSQVVQLMAWRDAGATLTLTYDADIRTVMVPLSGIDIEPIKQLSITTADSAICAGVLTMIEV